MTTVTYEHDLDISAEAAWEVLYDFGGFLKWAGGGQGSIEVDGEDVGMVRKMDIPGIGKIHEQLTERDSDNRALSYQLADGQPLGMAVYRCRVTVTEAGSGCRLDWRGEFEGAPGLDEAEIAENRKGSYIGMSGALSDYAKAGR